MTNQLPLFAGADTTTAPKVVLSLGMGADSSALLLRWITEPATRDFELDELVVVTAMTGSEWESTLRDTEEVLLPAMATNNIRFIQVGRSQRNVTKDGDGVVILDDSRQPARLHGGGDYRLATELLTAATVPQLGGVRKCSIKAKGSVLQPIIDRITVGQPYRHVLGFEVDELSRARKDALYNSETRTGTYPLIEWGWDRPKILEFLKTTTSRDWSRSACSFCPFAIATEKGRAATLPRFTSEPAAAVEALVIEATSLAINERQGLLGDRRLIDFITEAGLTDVLAAADAEIDAMAHAIYEVRRIVPAKAGQPDKAGPVWRSVVRRATGDRAAMDTALAGMPGRPITGASGITRMVLRSRDDHPGFPQLEHYHVVAPAVVEDKARPGFDATWREATESQQLFCWRWRSVPVLERHRALRPAHVHRRRHPQPRHGAAADHPNHPGLGRVVGTGDG